MDLSKKRVGLDARMWKHPGIGRYICELVEAMKRKPFDYSVTCMADPSFFDLLASEGPQRILREDAVVPIYGLMEQFQMASKAKKYDLLHVPHFNIPVFSKTPLVVTVHDLIYLREPNAAGSPAGRAYAQHLFGTIAKKAAAILAVSEFTKNDLLNAFPKIRPEKVTVTYEACKPFFQPMRDSPALQKTKEKHEKPFVLFVGTLKPHKNVTALLEAMKSIRARGLDHELVLVGKKDPKNHGLLQEIEALPWIRSLGEVGDGELCCLYNLAEVFVLPSFREGFGLPVVEAMTCGAPVVVSNRSSLPEVAGTAGRLFDPSRVDDLKELLYNVLQDADLRQKMRADGFVQAKKFSWDKTADQTLRVYEQVLR